MMGPPLAVCAPLAPLAASHADPTLVITFFLCTPPTTPANILYIYIIICPLCLGTIGIPNLDEFSENFQKGELFPIQKIMLQILVF